MWWSGVIFGGHFAPQFVEEVFEYHHFVILLRHFCVFQGRDHRRSLAIGCEIPPGPPCDGALVYYVRAEGECGPDGEPNRPAAVFEDVVEEVVVDHVALQADGEVAG